MNTQEETPKPSLSEDDGTADFALRWVGGRPQTHEERKMR